MKRAVVIILTCCWVLLCYAQTSADSATVVSLKWETDIIRKGMVHKHAVADTLYKGPQNINIIEITPRAGGCKFGIAITRPNEITSKTSASNKALAAINGSYFNIREGNSVCFLKVGKTVIDSSSVEVLKARGNGAVVVTKKRLMIIPWTPAGERAYRGNEGTVLSSGPLMIFNDSICSFASCSKSFVETKHPRSAVYITRDNKIGFITVDGRYKGKAEGVNIYELSHLLKLLGAKAALNLDGGGSTTLWSATAPGNGVLNYPCDNKTYDHQGERKVANIIYAY
jgi:exopolysaccharide biosynthesis protein